MSRVEVFLASKDKQGGGEKKEGALLLALLMLITFLWEVNSSIHLLLFMDSGMYSLWQGIIYLPVEDTPPGRVSL